MAEWREQRGKTKRKILMRIDDDDNDLHDHDKHCRNTYRQEFFNGHDDSVAA